MQEIEAKILDIDRGAIESRLRELGAQLEFDLEFFAIYYDSPDQSLSRSQQTLRLRKEGSQVSLTYKQKTAPESNILSREEIETLVSDFEATRSILDRLGYRIRKQMRKTRAQYALGESHIVIDDYLDEHAYIPVFIEIEGPSQEAVEACAVELGYSKGDLRALTAGDLIHYYQEKA